MDIQGNYDAENRNVLMWNKHNGLNQQWDIVYVKDMPDEPKKGEMNKDFNLKVDTSFHIISKMKGGRYLDILGRNLVIKVPNARKSQEFYFHQPSKTIRSRWNNLSFDIQSSGRSNNMQVWNTNSQWF